MADITTVVNDFSTARANASAIALNTQFTNTYEEASGVVNFAGGLAVVRCGTIFGNGMQTADTYTWNGTGFYFKPTPAPKGGAATEMSTFCAIVNGSSTDESIRIAWNVNLATTTNNLFATVYDTDNTYTDPNGATTLTYNSTTHAWLGWYYDATNVYWVYSANGTSWTTARTKARGTWSNFLTSGSALGFAFTTNRVAGSNTNANLDNLNINGTAPGGGGGGGSTNKGAGFMALLAA